LPLRPGRNPRQEWSTCECKRGYRTFAYYQAAKVTRKLLALRGELDNNDPATFQAYHRLPNDLSDPAGSNANVLGAIEARDLAAVARRYRLIDQNAIQVLVPWKERQGDSHNLRAEAEGTGITANWMRRA
jgi:hypothetical protein